MELRRTIAVARLAACPLMLAALLLATPALGDADASSATPEARDGTHGVAVEVTESPPEARALLKDTTEYLAGLQSFSVTVRAGYDVLQQTGQKIEFGEFRKLTLDRPGRLRVEKIESDGSRDLILFDGRTMTVLDSGRGVFAQAPEPGTIDDALVYFVRDLQMRLPLALLLSTRLPTELARLVKTADYVERMEIFGVPTHHIAARTDTVDFQVWVTDGQHPLPLRIVLTYPNEEGQPQFWANFSGWNTKPKLTSAMFKFVPPKHATQIVFAVQVPLLIGTPERAAEQKEVQP